MTTHLSAEATHLSSSPEVLTLCGARLLRSSTRLPQSTDTLNTLKQTECPVCNERWTNDKSVRKANAYYIIMP